MTISKKTSAAPVKRIQMEKGAAPAKPWKHKGFGMKKPLPRILSKGDGG